MRLGGGGGVLPVTGKDEKYFNYRGNIIWSDATVATI